MTKRKRNNISTINNIATSTTTPPDRFIIIIFFFFFFWMVEKEKKTNCFVISIEERKNDKTRKDKAWHHLSLHHLKSTTTFSMRYQNTIHHVPQPYLIWNTALKQPLTQNTLIFWWTAGGWQQLQREREREIGNWERVTDNGGIEREN